MPTTPDHMSADFAFEPPAMVETSSGNTAYDYGFKTPSYHPAISPGAPGSLTPTSFGLPSFVGYAPSAFSSGSGSANGSISNGPTSFSSADQSVFSRDFNARNQWHDPRRPATAGGALQTRSPWESTIPPRDKQPETIDETSELFTNAYSAPQSSGNTMSKTVDTSLLGPRRASDLQTIESWNDFAETPSQFSNDVGAAPLSSAPAHVNQFSFVPQLSHYVPPSNLQRPNPFSFSSRPFTSDGVVNVPSQAFPLLSGGGLGSGSTNPLLSRSVSTANLNGKPADDHALDGPATPLAVLSDQTSPECAAPIANSRPTTRGNDITPTGKTKTKQPSNTFPGSKNYSMNDDAQPFEEVRDTSLDYVSNGGNPHKKRPRRRYDEIERLYACGWQGCEKSYGTLNHLNAHVSMQKHGEKRLPSEFKDMRRAWRKKKREQQAAAANAQYMAQTQTWNNRLSLTSSESEFDRRESHDSSIFGSSDMGSQRGTITSFPFSWDSRPSTASSVDSTSDGRFGAISAYATDMINPAPALRRPSAPTHVPIPMTVPSFKMESLSSSTPTNGHHASISPFDVRPGSSGHIYGNASLPMTNAVPVGGQFAFQR